MSWDARSTLYAALDEYAPHVHYGRGLGGVPPLDVPHEGPAELPGVAGDVDRR